MVRLHSAERPRTPTSIWNLNLSEAIERFLFIMLVLSFASIDVKSFNGFWVKSCFQTAGDGSKEGEKCPKFTGTRTCLSLSGAAKPVDYTRLSLYYKTLRFISLHLFLCCWHKGILCFQMKVAILQSDNDCFQG